MSLGKKRKAVVYHIVETEDIKEIFHEITMQGLNYNF
jgi:hypothetical protein